MKEKSFLMFVFLLLFSVNIHGQTLSRHQADSVIRLIPSFETNVNGVKSSLKLTQFYIAKEGSSKKDLDSASYFLKKARFFAAPLNSAWANGYILLVEGQLSSKMGDEIKAKALIAQAVACLEKADDKILLGQAYYALSRKYPNYNDTKQLTIRIQLVEKAVQLLKLSPNREDYAADLQMLADLYTIESKFSKSLDVLKQCLSIYQAIHHKKLQGIYVLLNKNYNLLTDFHHALMYGLLAEKTCYETGDTTQQLCEVENAVASTYYYLNEMDFALVHFRKALTVAENSGNMTSMITIVHNICSVEIIIRRPKESLMLLEEFSRKRVKKGDVNGKLFMDQMYLNAYVDLKNFKLAEFYFRSCKEDIKSPKVTDYDIQNTYPTMIDYLQSIHNYVKARYYGQLFMSHAESVHNIYMRLKGYKRMYGIDSAIGDFKSAFYYTLRYKALNDSIFNEKKSKQIQELEYVYKTKEKDDSISLLHQAATLQDVELNRSKRTSDETIAGICVLLISGGFFIRHYRIKQKTLRTITSQNEIISAKSDEIVSKNKELEGLVQEKEYLLMEIHHRVKNNLHTVLSFLSLQARYLTGDALAAIKISRQRIYAMSLIHQKLYLADDVKTIDIKSYLNEFINYFKDCLSPDLPIKFVMDIDSLRIQVSKAISIGLIINEAVTNSAKYAFPDNREGVISINLKQKNELIELVISDNGIGMPEDMNFAEFNSLGIKLIKGLTNDLGGIINFESSTGTRIQIMFMEET